MAVYKVIQDVEAEDKLLGPLTLKQFIFAAVAIGSAFLGFLIASKTNFFVFIFFLPFIIIPGVLAAPFGKDQPTDIWLAALIRFWIKPRKRIWDQSGIKNLVTITAPKKIEKIYSDGLSQQEIRSRLKALAETIDSHGWAVKNADINLFASPEYAFAMESDRLVDPTSLPQVVPDVDISAADDILDAQSNPIAQHFDTMVKESTAAQRQAAIDRMHSVANSTPAYDSRHAPQQAELPPDAVMFGARLVAPGQEDEAKNNFAVAEAHQPHSQEEVEELEVIKAKQQQARAVAEMITPHHQRVKTPEEKAAEAAALLRAQAEQAKQAQAVTPPKNPVIVNLATNKEVTRDLSIKTISDLANRKPASNDKEVVVHLH